MNNNSPVKTYGLVFAALLFLLGLTVGAWAIDFGRFNIAVAMTIALAKALLVLLFFMHVKDSDHVVWVYASAAAVWILIALALSMSDYLTRVLFVLPGS